MHNAHAQATKHRPWCLFNLPSLLGHQKFAEVKVFCWVSADPGNPTHNKISKLAHCRLKKKVHPSWLKQPKWPRYALQSRLRQGKTWSSTEDKDERLTQVISTLIRECSEYAPGVAHAKVESLIVSSSKTAQWLEQQSQDGDSLLVLMELLLLKALMPQNWHYADRNQREWQRHV